MPPANQRAKSPSPTKSRANSEVSSTVSLPRPLPRYLSRISEAEAAIRLTDERLTQSRVAVLACLLTFGHAASHHDVAAELTAHHPMDRVTVYRVLEWLVTVGIAHRIAGDDRVWRFQINDPTAKAIPDHHQHAHFACDACGQTFCLGELPESLNFQLPRKFKPTHVDLKFRGRCATCASGA